MIVTGAAQGIGRAVALRLAAHGVHLAVWDVQRDGVEETAELCREKGATSRAFTVDAGDADAIEAAVANFERDWGKPDGLVNNAGIFPRARALDMDLAEWDQVLRVNLTGTFVTARAVAARMKDEGRGAIVNTASGRALAGAANGAHYSASKGGIIAFTKTAAIELAKFNVTVNALAPGFTETDMLAKVAQPVREQILAKIPMGRFGQPREIANAVAFLCAEGDYITGQQINVNGGVYM